jgi:UV radiation resistance-associated gene protein
VFPIELISASELLFGIVELPLPPTGLPVEPNSPKPSQTSLNINEETVSSALGLLAQVVQLAAAYLGMSLPYPITCIGSRSNIKDPISLMAGPRK